MKKGKLDVYVEIVRIWSWGAIPDEAKKVVFERLLVSEIEFERFYLI